MKTFTALAVLAAGAELASATFFDASAFSCPSNTNNQCNPQQSSGFDWTSLNLGSFQNYGDFEFSGWECAGSFGSGRKRDVISGRTFQDKCITGKASHDKSNSPSFGCGKSPSVKDFSVVEFEVSVEFDCELEFHFEMPNKSQCKQKTRCSKGGSVVKNKQCGGATSVTVIYPTQTSGPGTTKTACSLGFHSMSFDCSSASTTKTISTTKSKPTSVRTTPATTLATTTSVPVTTSKPAETTKSVSKPGETASTSVVVVTSSTSSVSVPETTSSAKPVVSTSSTFGFFNTTSSVVVPSSSAPGTTKSDVTLTTSVPVTSVPVTSVPVTTASITSTTSVDVVTVIVSTSTTICPFTSTHVTGGTTSTEIGTTTSTIVSTITSTICTKCTASTILPLPSVPGTPISPPSFTLTSSTPSGPLPTAPCPPVVPSCLNTWLFLSGCTSNTDADCYCPSAEFVSTIFDCLSAYAADDDEIASAQTYFQGICAPHIPSNPAIVTGATTALATTAPPATATSVPVTTIQIVTTLTVPCIESTGISSGSTIPSSSTTTLISTVLTVPQVVFQTITGTSTVSADLVAGTPPAVPAVNTPAPTLAAPTVSVSRTSTGGVGATNTPIPFVGAAGRNTLGLGAVFGAVLVALVAV